MLFFHFWKTALDFKNVQNSMKVLKITKPRRITCDTALESWRSIIFDEKVFYLPSTIFYPFFFHMSKKTNSNFWKIHQSCSCEKRGVKNFWGGYKTFSSKSMDLQLFNAVSHVILRGLVISEMNFEICHRIRKKRYRSCPGLLQISWKYV